MLSTIIKESKRKYYDDNFIANLKSTRKHVQRHKINYLLKVY